MSDLDEGVPMDPEPEPEPEPAMDRATELLGPENEMPEPKSMRNVARCQGRKKDGMPCGMVAVSGSDFCRHHGGLSRAMRRAEVREHTDPKKPIQTLPFPFVEGSVNENSAIRVIRMAKPNCPRESNPDIVGRDGSIRPNPRYTGEESCERAYRINTQGRWDVYKCIELGHDPFYTVFRRTVLQDTMDENGYVTESRPQIQVEKRLNVVAVSDNIRHSTGQEVQLAIARGCVPLEEFVCTCSRSKFEHKHEVPCEFRNCTQPRRVDTRYGWYCSERHARLIAADKQRKILPVGGDPYSQEQAMTEREDILGNLNIRRGA